MRHTTRGTLYLVGTPIGNLEDMTLRAIRVLRESDEVLCEDTRVSRVLMQHFGIDRRTGSFHAHSSEQSAERVREWLFAGKSVAYVSDAGTPGVSDPGAELIRVAVEAEALVVPIPGVSAVSTLISVAAFESNAFNFLGFFPRKKSDAQALVEKIKSVGGVHLFFESAERILQTLEILQESFSETACVLGRELTKLHEEILRGSVSDVLESLKSKDRIRGEIVFGIEAVSTKPSLSMQNLSDEHQAELAAALKTGRSKKDIAAEFSQRWGVSKKAVYDFLVGKKSN